MNAIQEINCAEDCFMVLGAEIMVLLKSMIVLPLTSNGLGFHLRGLATGERGLLEEIGPEKHHRKNNTGRELYVSRAESGDNSNTYSI